MLVRTCNVSDKLNELNVCYTFVDAVFTRDLFLLLSWAGGSKGSTTKTGFKAFQRTINFFISLVRTCHPNFSMTSCESFFKTKSIANATTRAKTAQVRVSRTKSRTSKNKKRDESDENDDEDIITETDADSGQQSSTNIETVDSKIPESDQSSSTNIETLDSKIPESDQTSTNNEAIDSTVSNPKKLAAKFVHKFATNIVQSLQSTSGIEHPKGAPERKRRRVQKLGFHRIKETLLLDENDSTLEDSDVSRM